MNSTQEIRQKAKEIRQRLRNPPNAVPDPGFRITRISSGVKGGQIPAPEAPTEPVGAPPPKLNSQVALPLTFERIIKVVAHHCGLTPQNLKGACRRRDITRARKMAFYLGVKFLKNRTKASMSRELKKDHSSLLYVHREITELMAGDLVLAHALDQLAESLSANYSH